MWADAGVCPGGLCRSSIQGPARPDGSPWPCLVWAGGSCCSADHSSHTLPCHVPALWEPSLNNTLMEKFMKNQIIAAGRELKPFFIPRIPGPRLRAPPWEHRTSHPSLWPAITGTDYSCNSLLIGSGAGTAVNTRLQPCLPSRGCHQHRPRQNAMGQWTEIPPVLLLPWHWPEHSAWGQPSYPPLFCLADSYLTCNTQLQCLLFWEAFSDAALF